MPTNNTRPPAKPPAKPLTLFGIPLNSNPVLQLWWVVSLVFAAIGAMALFAYGDFSSNVGVRRMYFRTSWWAELLEFTGIRVTLPAVTYRPRSAVPRFSWNRVRLRVPLLGLLRAANEQFRTLLGAVDSAADGLDKLRLWTVKAIAVIKRTPLPWASRPKPKVQLSYRPPSWKEMQGKYGRL